MPQSSDKQPLLPPALRRIQHLDLKNTGQESKVTPLSLPDEASSELDERDNSEGAERKHNTESRDEVVSCDEELCVQGESIQGHQISRLILLNQRLANPLRKPRQSKSTVPGVMSQFSQLQGKKSLLHRLTLSIANLFGRMCARHRDMTPSSEVGDKENGDQEAGQAADETNETAASVSSCSSVDGDTVCRAGSRSNSPENEYFLQDTEQKISDMPTPRLERIFSHNMDIDFDLHSDGEDFEDIDITHDPRGRDRTRDLSVAEEEDTARLNSKEKTDLDLEPDASMSKQSSIFVHRPRQRWTFLSALRLLPLPRSRSIGHRPLRESDEELEVNGCDSYPDNGGKMRLELDLTGDQRVTSLQ